MNVFIRLLRNAAKDSRVTLVAGALLGVLTDLYALQAAAVLVALTVGVFGLAFVDERRALKKHNLSVESTEHMLSPTPLAREVVDAANKN